MVSKKPLNRRDPNDPEPALQYKYRGQYEDGRITIPRIVFSLTRLASIGGCYSILASPQSAYSVFSYFPSIAPTRPPSSANPHVPFLSEQVMTRLMIALQLSSLSSTLVFFMVVGFSCQFLMYSLVWRRERMPLTGDGGALQVGLAAMMVDLVPVLVFVHLAEWNPTWSAALIGWTMWPFFLGLVLQMSSDQIKHEFKSRGENRNGDILSTGPWALVRNPNYTGFHIWKCAMSVGLFGWAVGPLLGWMILRPTLANSIPSVERHMAQKYGGKFEVYRRRVRYRLIPGIY